MYCFLPFGFIKVIIFANNPSRSYSTFLAANLEYPISLSYVRSSSSELRYSNFEQIFQDICNKLARWYSFQWFYNLRVASFELRVASCNFRKINLRVVSSFLRIANLFCELEIKLRVVSCFLRVASWRFKEILLRVASSVL